VKILYTLNSGSPGGMEQHVLDLVTGMANRGHEVFVWCKEGPIVEQFQKAGAKTTTTEITFDICPSYILALTEFLKKEKVEVVHAHELKAAANTLIAGYLAKTPVKISHTHTPISEWKIDPFRKRVNVLANTFLVNYLATREIALTESRKNTKISEGIREGKLMVIPNGVNIDKFTFSPVERAELKKEILERYKIPTNAFTFGFLSRITKEKGHDVLVKAFANFLKRAEQKGQDVSNVYLLLAGGGNLEDSIKKLATDLGISKKVVITGVFDAVDLTKFYASFDAFVFPSLAEGFGIVLIEAMASELSIICSDLPVLQEVGGSTVMYSEVGNVEELTEKMYDLYVRFDRFEQVRQDARRRVADLFSLENFVTKYENLYLELLEGMV